LDKCPLCSGQSLSPLEVSLADEQILQGYRNDMLSNGGEEGARQKIEKWLNPDGGLSWIVGLISIQSVSSEELINRIRSKLLRYH